MGQEFMDAEIFSEFVIEAREHLESIEPNLLELEKDPDNLSLLDDIFRPMHSLKGASGFLGLNTINNLAHKGENVLDELRKGRMRVTPRIMDTILQATDALREMIDNLEESGSEGNVETEEIINSFSALLHGNGEPSPKVPQPEPIENTETEQEEKDFEAESDGDSYHLTIANPDHLNDFLEEAQEIIAALNDSLVRLEKLGENHDLELVNDIFRYFHNLKGNSGIIGYNELNALTHEAETLLNRIRKEEINVNRGIIDLLLSVLDVMEALLEKIDIDSAEVTPMDIGNITDKLRKCTESDGKIIETEDDEDLGNTDDSDDIDDEDLKIFKDATKQQFNAIHIALDTLKNNGTDKESIDGLYRSLVTIQNSAAYMSYNDLKVYAQRTAGLVDQARSMDMDFTDMYDILYQECSILEQMVNALVDEKKESTPPAQPEVAQPEPKQPEPELIQTVKESSPKKTSNNDTVKPKDKPQKKQKEIEPKPSQKAKPKPAEKSSSRPAPAKSKEKNKVSATIRVDHSKLDHLMNLIGELIINRNRFSMLARGLEGGEEPAEIAQQLTETTYAMARISDDLQDTIMNVRMVPVQTVFSRFPRLVRDLSRKSGKKVELITQGEETELDKSVVEVIGDPLVHLIRNSMDHGLEGEEERIAAGKDSVGRVWLRAAHKGNSVIIEVEDDGRGIDPAKTKAKAVEKGVITEDDARNMDEREAIDLIFAPGFSTAEKVTDISGRGVGMDVVRSNIKELKGNVSVQSELGKGSKFTLSLPLTLAIIDALMVKVCGDTFAIPLDAVSETTKIDVNKLSEVNKRKALTLRGEVLGIVGLDELLDLPASENDERQLLPIVILIINERRIGLVVDSLLERQEIVIKSMGSYLGNLQGISGATIMGDGNVILILDPHEIYRLATSRGAL